MKSPKTKFVVISAISLVSIVGIFVSAQSPTPKVGGQDNPVQLVMACVPVNKVKLMDELKNRPSDTFRIQYEGDAPVGTLPTMTPPPCPIGLVGNATQRATFKNTQELHKFLVDTGL
jgi:hypothetical protein